MRKMHASPRQCGRLWYGLPLLFLSLLLSLQRTDAQSPSQLAVQLSAVVQAVPPQITLSWPDDGGYAQGYEIWRKGVDDHDWGSPVAVLPSTTRQYVDKNVQVGVCYEYRVGKVVGVGGVSGLGYLRSGIEVPLVEHRGTVILVVDTDTAAAMPAELAQLERDLVGDGWGLLRHDVSPTAQPVAIRRMLQNDYYARPTEVRSVLLFGKVPIQKSGFFAPDGHASRSFPCDPYYADLDGTWSDVRSDTGFTPNDGTLDQDVMPSTMELECGRVYLGNMPTFAPKDEMTLLRQYLVKDHNFRQAAFVPQRRALFDDAWWYGSNLPIMTDAWQTAAPLVGYQQIFEKHWDSELPTNSYLWAMGGGPGNYTTAGGVTSTNSTAVLDPKAVFTMLFGSYFCEWDVSDNLLRAILASNTMGLTSNWAVWPYRLLFPMGMGETIGYGTRLTQDEDSGLYNDNMSISPSKSCIAVALMGDPTLRMHIVPPPGALTATVQGSVVCLAWTASTDPGVIGYHIYRAPDLYSPFTRLNDDPISGTTFQDNAPRPGANIYQVRAIKLEVSPSGSYFNASQGAFATATLASPTVQPDLQVRNAADTYYAGDNLYLDDAQQTRSQYATLNTPTVYALKVENDGTASDTLKLTAPAPGAGWSVRYYDALSGGTEITGSLTGAGWPVSLAVHAAREFRAEVTMTSATATACALPVTAASTTDGSKTDRVVLAPLPAVAVQPDLSIRLATETGEVGVGVYDPMGTVEQISRPVPAGTSLNYLLKVTNPAATAQPFVLTRLMTTMNYTNWQVACYDAPTGGNDITTATNTGWMVTIPPNASCVCRVQLTAKLPPAGQTNTGDVLNSLFSVSSVGAAPLSDALTLSGTITAAPPSSAYQPDMKIGPLPRTSTYDFFWNTNDTYNNDPVQTMSVASQTEASHILYLSVENDDKQDADTITVTAPAGGNGWSLQFFDANTGGNDITSQLTSPQGWVCANLAPGAYQDFRMVITAAAGTPLNTPVDFFVTGVSQHDPTKTDRVVVHAVCSVLVQADVMLRNPGETDYTGDNLYEYPPTLQVKAQTVQPNQTAVYEVREQNDSPMTNRFSMSFYSGTKPPAGWKMTVWDVQTGEDVTDRFWNYSWSTPHALAPGETYDFRIEITPDASVSQGAGYSIGLYAYPYNLPITRSDYCQLNTTCGVAAAAFPDLQIRPAPATDYQGDNVYFPQPQSVGQNVRRTGTASYALRMQNDGIAADSITLTGPASADGWTYRYYDDSVAGTEITDQVTNGGWTAVNLAPAATRECRVLVTPSATAPLGTINILSITATSVGNPAKADVVSAATTLLGGVQPDAMIRVSTNPTYLGEHCYNTLNAQTVTQQATAGTRAVYLLQLRNDGDDTGALQITGNGGGNGWTVRYYTAETGGSDITAQVTGAGYCTGAFAPGTDHAVLRLEVTADTGAPDPSWPVTVQAVALTDPDHTDAVRAITSNGEQPVGFEADVAPRTIGNGRVSLADWVQIGRFAAGLDTPTADEFSRADCAPRETLGDGQLNLSDWVQAGRYAAGIDPLTPVGGPTQLVDRAPAQQAAAPTGAARTVHFGPATRRPDGRLAVPVVLQARGDECAVTFTLGFDARQVTIEAVQPATGMAVNINRARAAQGLVGIAAMRQPDTPALAPGPQTLVVLVLRPATGYPGPLTFNDAVLPCQLVSAQATPLLARFIASGK